MEKKYYRCIGYEKIFSVITPVYLFPEKLTEDDIARYRGLVNRIFDELVGG